MTPLEQLGRDMAATQQELLAQRNDLHQVRSRLLAPRRRPRRLVWSAAALASTAALVLAVALYAWLRPAPPTALSFTIDQESAPHRQLPAPLSEQAKVSFSDGTTVELFANSSGRVEEVSPRGARISLRQGQALVDVVPHPEARWEIIAGPFELRVLGTRFSVSWDPDDRELNLSMAAGTVRVAGPGLAQRVVTAGQSLRVWSDQQRTYARLGVATGGPPSTETTEPSDGTTGPAGLPPPSVALGLEDSAGVEEDPAPLDPVSQPPRLAPAVERAERVTAGEAPDESTWQELARQGRYDAAFSLVEQLGWEEQLAQATAGQLGELAEVARLAGQAEGAATAYRQLRERFPGTEGAASAAFQLGRLISRAPNSAAQAARWFQAYLAERPDGPFAREALGRLIERYLALGDAAGARAAARRYLSLYPDGPHAAVARPLEAE